MNNYRSLLHLRKSILFGGALLGHTDDPKLFSRDRASVPITRIE